MKRQKKEGKSVLMVRKGEKAKRKRETKYGDKFTFEKS